MKERDGYDAPFFGLPNGQNPEPHAKPFYGSTRVPHPTNTAAEKVDHAAVMCAVMKGK